MKNTIWLTLATLFILTGLASAIDIQTNGNINNAHNVSAVNLIGNLSWSNITERPATTNTDNNFVYGFDTDYPYALLYKTIVQSILNVNRSNYWDSYDTLLDIVYTGTITGTALAPEINETYINNTIDTRAGTNIADQPSIDASNITSGTIENDRYNMTYLNAVINGTELWANASNQDGRIDALEAGGTENSANTNNITEIWGNYTITLTNITALEGNLSENIDNVTAVWGNLSVITVNITAIHGNISNLWSNASTVTIRLNLNDLDIAALKLNDTNQETKFVELWANATAQYTLIASLNLTQTSENITSLWANVTNHDGRITNLEAVIGTPEQPNINWANITEGTPPRPIIHADNITAGTILNARYNMTYLPTKLSVVQGYVNYSSCGALKYWVFGSGCTDLVSPNATQTTFSDLAWVDLNDHIATNSSVNSGNVNITGNLSVGSDLFRLWGGSAFFGLSTGATINVNNSLSVTGDVNASGEICDGAGNCLSTVDSGQAVKPIIDAANITTGTILNARYNMTYLAQVGNITDLWTNASDQQTHITNLWSNASTQENRFVPYTGADKNIDLGDWNITVQSGCNPCVNSTLKYWS